MPRDDRSSSASRHDRPSNDPQEERLTFFSIYVGSVKDPNFSRDPDNAKSSSCNLPSRLTPGVPPSGQWRSVDYFSTVVRRIHVAKYYAREVDWDGFAARLLPQEIRGFVDEFFPRHYRNSAPPECPDVWAHLDAELETFRAAFDAVPEGEYYLVAAET